METKADNKVERPPIVPGQPLPKGFKNPPCGEPGHKCVDLRGNYAPNWVSMMVMPDESHKTRYQLYEIPEMGDVNIKIGVWVDVHPAAVDFFASPHYEITELDFEPDSPITQDGVVRKTTRIPRFGVNVRPSA